MAVKMYYDSIGELSRRIHEQAVSPVEVVEACLKRIETLNPRWERVHHRDGR